MGIKEMPDIQKQRDKRNIFIDRVGVSNVEFPLYIDTKEGNKVLIYATIGMYSSLHHSLKGTNMSRFVETLMDWQYKTLNASLLHTLLKDLKQRLGKVDDVYIDLNFKYFLNKFSPVTNKACVNAYNCSFIGSLKDKYKFILKVNVPVTSVCPCSKAISKAGAHGQKGMITVEVETTPNKFLWLEDLIVLIEQQGSCEIYPLLKRPDEKYVTEKAHNNPKFVEDIARDVALTLSNLNSINKYKIKVENYESIHQHNAKCYIARTKLKGKWVKNSNLNQI